MTKSELITLVARDRTDVGSARVEAIINLTLKHISKALLDGEKVQLLGFGTFSVKTRVAREGTNPRTGEAINVPESKRVHFSTSKTLKDALNR